MKNESFCENENKSVCVCSVGNLFKKWSAFGVFSLIYIKKINKSRITQNNKKCKYLTK
jgi:hypothetical protein